MGLSSEFEPRLWERNISPVDSSASGQILATMTGQNAPQRAREMASLLRFLCRVWGCACRGPIKGKPSVETAEAISSDDLTAIEGIGIVTQDRLNPLFPSDARHISIGTRRGNDLDLAAGLGGRGDDLFVEVGIEARRLVDDRLGEFRVFLDRRSHRREQRLVALGRGLGQCALDFARERLLSLVEAQLGPHDVPRLAGDRRLRGVLGEAYIRLRDRSFLLDGDDQGQVHVLVLQDESESAAVVALAFGDRGAIREGDGDAGPGHGLARLRNLDFAHDGQSGARTQQNETQDQKTAQTQSAHIVPPFLPCAAPTAS